MRLEIRGLERVVVRGSIRGGVRGLVRVVVEGSVRNCVRASAKG